ncbi:Alkaline phosphatase synthesis sensor protein PhoR [Arthrobacter saudimassiliensis]|uniref:histidine kinase n=1 Tax=Arthrobacter saudimassiliensis TaxID=1461584 RepID=A0A078MSK6_9MICC|nr:Alkaline phosphatase synthesis sensor protein PhoR [Arthrobacter saudimassiliensis]
MSHDPARADVDYAALFHDAPSGYLVTRTDGTIVEANATLLAWLGRRRHEVVGSSLLDLLPVGDRIVYTTHALSQLGLMGAFAELAVDLRGADGVRLPALLSGTRAAGTGGLPDLDRIIVFNAHERRLYERELVAALRKAEEAEAARAAAEASSRRKQTLLESVLNTVEVGVTVVDAEGNTVLTNARQRANFKRAVPEGMDRPDECQLLLFGPDRVTPLPTDLRPIRRVTMGQSYSDELVWIGTGEGQRALSTTARPIRGDDESFTGSVIAFSDVTDLVSAISAKDDFVANVSHELRTPLTSIMGYLDLALEEEDELPPHVASALRVALRNSEKLLQLVSDLLSAAAGQTSMEPAPTDLAEIVRAALTSVAPRAEANGVELAADIPERLPAVVDGQRISQVLDNLLSNAVKYSPDGGRTTVRARREDGMVRIEVEDSGIGMTESEQSEVFTKFFRSVTARRAAIPGVGLGLAISRSIVEAHGGTITLRSQSGRGTCFTVLLPVG